MTSAVLLDHCIIAGPQYRKPFEKKRLAEMKKGDALILAREPTNSHDPKAVQVLSDDGVHVGYVPRPLNIPIFGLLEAGFEVRAGIVDVQAGPRGYANARFWVKLRALIGTPNAQGDDSAPNDLDD
jgi:hypothetical protein